MRNAIQCLVPVVVMVAISCGALAADERKGREIYDMHCAACHGPNGVSTDPMIPSFADGETLYRMDSELLQRIGDGKNTMPAFRGLLSSEEMRDVIAYLRTF